MPSPITSNTDLLSYSIKVDGTELATSYQVYQIEVFKSANKIPYAKVVLQDGAVAEQTFPASDSATFLPGATIDIQLGYNSTNNSVFKGLIIKHGIRTTRNGTTELVLECRGKAIKMTLGRKTNIESEKLDSDVLKTLISNYGLTATVTATTVTHPQMIQYDMSDWDFLLMRADACGLTVFAEADEIKVAAPTVGSAVLDISFGDSVYDMNLYMDAMTQLSGTESSTWDMATLALIKATGSASASLNGDVTSDTLAGVAGVTSKLVSSANLQQGDIQAWASSQLLKSKFAKIQGKISFQGSHLVLPNTAITLANVGNRFNGTAYVGGVKHTVREGNWVTEAHLGLDSQWFVEQTPHVENLGASGVVPPIKGLMIGMVTKMHEDPDGKYRIQIKLPMLQKDTELMWARMANFYATVNAGSFFLPEVGDEVVVSFLNEDPRFPIILGSLYNSTSTAPLTAAAENYHKAFITKAQLKMTFDDENKIIEIVTPNANKITFSDKDQKITILDETNNKIEMSTSGIAITSDKDITIKAANISMEATQNITIKAGVDLKGEGVNIEWKASAQATVKGALAELSSSGVTTVKGSLVKIN